MAGGLFGSFDVSASGLSAQRRRLDVIAENLANAETTRTAEGGPYRRRRVTFEAAAEPVRSVTRRAPFVDLVRDHVRHLGGADLESARPGAPEPTVRVNVAEDPSPFRTEYDPGHPDADENGYVLKPNVNVVDEMVDMILAVRAYQANAMAFEAAKDMFTVSLQI